MSFLKIDKKNIFSFSKIVLVIAFVAIFSFGFAEAVDAQAGTGGYVTNKGLPDNVQVLSTSARLSVVDSTGKTITNVYQADNKLYYQKSSDMQGTTMVNTYSQVTPRLDSKGNPDVTVTGKSLSDATNGTVTDSAQNGTSDSGGGGRSPLVDHQGQCFSIGVGGVGAFLDAGNCLIIGLYYGIFWPLSWLVGIAGWLFNYTFTITVLSMASGIDKIGAIDVAWKTMRDLANIGFIFILLYLAISTILGVGEHDVKKTLSKLITVAVLLNFSLFFTKVIIDASNILAIAFFHAITVNGGTGGIGDAFMAAFRLQSLYSVTKTLTNGNAVAVSSVPFSILAGGSITMIVALVILISALVMFIKRYVILILVMIFSPLAFAGMVLHQTEGYVHEWWNYLLKEAFFAPMYMILLWISFTVINNPGFLAALGEGGTRDSSDNLLATSLQAGDNGTTGNGTAAEKNAGVLLDFMIVSALLIATLIVAEKMGVAGASGAMNFAKGAQGAIQGGAMFAVGSGFNNTVGKAVRTWKEKGVSAGLYGRASGFDEHGKAVGWASKWTARAQVAIADNLASGYNKKLDFEAKYREAAKHEFHDDPERIAQQAIDIGMGSKNSTEQQGFEQDWDKMSTKQKANVMLHMKAKGGEGNRMFSRLFTEHGHGRNTDQEIREIIRQTKQGNEFFDDELNKILERGNADELQAWLSNKDRTQGQIISALEAVKDAGRNKLKAVTPAGDALRDALTRGLRNKGGGEATFVGIARNDLIDDDIKKLSGSAAQEIASLNDIVKIMRDNPAAKNDAILVDKLKHLAGRIDSDDMRETVRQANMIHGNLTVATDMILDAYKTKFADDSSTAAVMHQTNGARGVKVSQESIAAKEAIIEDGQRFGVNIDSTYKR